MNGKEPRSDRFHEDAVPGNVADDDAEDLAGGKAVMALDAGGTVHLADGDLCREEKKDAGESGEDARNGGGWIGWLWLLAEASMLTRVASFQDGSS